MAEKIVNGVNGKVNGKVNGANGNPNGQEVKVNAKEVKEEKEVKEGEEVIPVAKKEENARANAKVNAAKPKSMKIVCTCDPEETPVSGGKRGRLRHLGKSRKKRKRKSIKRKSRKRKSRKSRKRN
jgi:hypothetical protein